MVIKADRMKFPRVLTDMEVARMFRAAEANKRDEMLLKCMYYLGLKSNELQALTVGDIDVNENRILIRGRNERALMIPGQFPFELTNFSAGRDGSELIFSGRGAVGGLSDRHIRRIVKDYARLADVRNYEEIKPHTLRISYAAHLRKDGVPVKSIQQLLGHARRETTYIYTHGLQQMGLNKTENEPENTE
jgi:integrase/recombinase XerD